MQVFSFRLLINFFIVYDIYMSLISSNSDISRHFQKEYVYPEWFTAKKYYFYQKILRRLDKLTYVHSNSAEYYSKLNMRIFGPSITITAFSSIASFMSTASFMDTNLKNGFAVTVGVLATISTMMQSLASALGYSAKIASHRQAAEEYNKLIVRLKFEMEMPNEKNFTNDMEAQILDIQNKCKFFPPQHIEKEYDTMKIDRKLNKLKEVKVDNMIDQIEDGSEAGDTQLNSQVNDMFSRQINNNINNNLNDNFNSQLSNQLQPFNQGLQHLNQLNQLNQGLNQGLNRGLNQGLNTVDPVNNQNNQSNDSNESGA